MTPAARVQAAIELLDAIITSARDGGAAADTLIARYFKERRYAGSSDRRAVRAFVYETIRRNANRPSSGRAAMLGLAGEQPDILTAFDGSPHGPAIIKPDEPVTLDAAPPRWLRDAFASECDAADITSLAGRAPLDLRVNAMHATREQVLARLEGVDAVRGRASRAIRLPEGYPITDHPVWMEGLVDIQDEGSQLVAEACGVGAGATVVDLCAGGGGKTLALYDAMAGEGRLIACDTDRARLAQLTPRARRSRMPGIQTRLLDAGREAEQLNDLAGAADLVLLDAPCSGTGTWRRNPEGRWRLAPALIARHAARQYILLDLAARMVAPGGFLVYAVCSMLSDEGKSRISCFLGDRSDFRKVDPAIPFGLESGDGVLLTPARHQTDGFFIARLQRLC